MHRLPARFISRVAECEWNVIQEKYKKISGKQDLNLRPQRPERRALPAALLPVNKKSFQNRKLYARVTGLEPVISGVTGQRDNQLRYTRVMCLIIYVFYEIVNT